MDDPLEVNRARWDELARLHGQDAYYDVAGFLAGASSLSSRELEAVERAVGTVAGRDLLHLQCHFGLDTLSFARLGARVTGVDFSGVAVRRARELAREAGLVATFVQADAQALPPDLAGRFDVVFASYGVLCWIADVDAWMRSAAAALRPGGSLVLVDIHPMYNMVESVEPLRLDFPHQGARPFPSEEPGSYADPALRTTSNRTVVYAHGMGEIITAAAGAEFRIEALTEWLDDDFDPRGTVLARDPDGRYRLLVGGEHLPVTFELRARRD
jgi:SAM-dependent methyltransferase